MKIRFLLYVALLAIFNSCTNYGKKVVIDNVDIYYKDGATKGMAEKLGVFLKKMNFNEDGTKKSIQLMKAKNKEEYIFSMVVQENLEKDESYNFHFEAMSRELEPVLGAPVTIRACNKYFKPLKTFEASKISKSISKGNVELVYTLSVTQKEAQATLNYWSEIISAETKSVILLDKQNEKYTFKMVVLEKYFKNTSLDYAFLELKKDLQEILKTDNLDFVLCDENMNPVRAL